MRTTLDLDDRLLAVARERAATEGVSLGRAVSELALLGIEAESAELQDDGEFLVLPAVPGHVVTSKMVEDALDEH